METRDAQVPPGRLDLRRLRRRLLARRAGPRDRRPRPARDATGRDRVVHRRRPVRGRHPVAPPARATVVRPLDPLAAGLRARSDRSWSRSARSRWRGSPGRPGPTPCRSWGWTCPCAPARGASVSSRSSRRSCWLARPGAGRRERDRVDRASPGARARSRRRPPACAGGRARRRAVDTGGRGAGRARPDVPPRHGPAPRREAGARRGRPRDHPGAHDSLQDRDDGPRRERRLPGAGRGRPVDPGGRRPSSTPCRRSCGP